MIDTRITASLKGKKKHVGYEFMNAIKTFQILSNTFKVLSAA